MQCATDPMLGTFSIATKEYRGVFRILASTWYQSIGSRDIPTSMIINVRTYEIYKFTTDCTQAIELQRQKLILQLSGLNPS